MPWSGRTTSYNILWILMVLGLVSITPLHAQEDVLEAVILLVSDEETGRPLADAVAPEAGSRNVLAQADSTGAITVELHTAVPTQVVIEAFGYEPHAVTVPAGSDTMHIALRPAPVGVEGLTVESQRTYNPDQVLRRRLRGSDFRASIVGQMTLLSTDARNMVDFLWEETRARLMPCPSGRSITTDSCMNFSGRIERIILCIDDMRAPGGPSMLYSYRPSELYRVEVLRDIGQVRIYTRPYIARLIRTGRAAPVSYC